MRPSHLLPLVLALSLALAACAGRGADLPRLPPSSGEYRLAPGDQLRVITAGDETLTGEFRVADNGNIALPLLGPGCSGRSGRAGLPVPAGVQEKYGRRCGTIRP